LPISPADPVLHLIDLDQLLPGQRRFISCWVSVGPDVIFLVDPGPPSSADHLIKKLEDLNLPRLDFILLTHVHLDHGGATAAVLEHWPQAKVICHPKGRAHIIDPTRLWEGSLQVLGEKAQVYGQPGAVKADSVLSYSALDQLGIEVVSSPGHAPHHVCFRHGDTLFLGEAAGTFSSLGNGPDTCDYYLRPATPPKFFPKVALASLERLADLNPLPSRLIFAHHGSFTGDVPLLLGTASQQLKLWISVAEEVLSKSGLDLRQASASQLNRLREKTAEKLLVRDPLYERRVQLPADIQQREKDFTHQTLRGIFGYLASR